MTQLGFGAMLQMLSSNKEDVEILKQAIGKKIVGLKLDGEDESLHFVMEDDLKFRMFDGGQSCCESRYMRTDDKVEDFIGATLVDVEVAAAPEPENKKDDDGDYYGDVHEVQFLRITTDRGVLVMSNHNEHNGYYGGIYVRVDKE